jgi:rhodanese-related sulfurtransferase
MRLPLPRTALLPLLFALILAACGGKRADAPAGSPPATSDASVPATISVEDLKARLASGRKVVVLDVRTPEELSGPLGALADIINIPIEDIDARVGDLEKYRADDIAVICRSGHRSGVATAQLREKGFRASSVEGGMIAWREKYGSAPR